MAAFSWDILRLFQHKLLRELIHRNASLRQHLPSSSSTYRDLRTESARYHTTSRQQPALPRETNQRWLTFPNPAVTPVRVMCRCAEADWTSEGCLIGSLWNQQSSYSGPCSPTISFRRVSVSLCPVGVKLTNWRTTDGPLVACLELSTSCSLERTFHICQEP